MVGKIEGGVAVKYLWGHKLLLLNKARQAYQIMEIIKEISFD